MSRRILILTFPEDLHAVEVALALRALGHEPVLWHGSDFPVLQHASLVLDPDDCVNESGAVVHWDVGGPELAIADQPFDAVWFRRPSKPSLPDDMHPGDLPVARRQCDAFVRGLWHSIAPDAFHVNPLQARERANLKAVQLQMAAQVGLRIPPTLMSNDPARIRAFIANARGPVIFKPFVLAQWRDGEDVALSMTNEVRSSDLPDDDILRSSPGIFQPRLRKAHELRVTYMGGHMVTAKILSQTDPAASLDWRLHTENLPVEPTELPPSLSRAIDRLMSRLGLVFGCLDFIVTPEGDHVFLEVNPMGQFLWVEALNPEILVLDPFCRFLCNGAGVFHYQRGEGAVVHRDFRDAARAHSKAIAPLHVERPSISEQPDAAPQKGVDRRRAR